MIKFNKSRLAATVGALALAGAAAPASAVVVVGGDNGWEISFDGNVNVFFTVGDYDANAASNAHGNDVNTARVHTGLLPAFFSFNAKAPTWNGITGSARISFAPQIQTGGDKTQILGSNATGGTGINGASNDVREVVFNLDGSFGQISMGRTLSLFGRQAILNDQTLFGVGYNGSGPYGGTTAGRIGNGYIYPDFAARIQYTTPMMNGFQASVGLFDPSTIAVNNGAVGTIPGVQLDEWSTPRFEGEASYTTNLSNASVKLWVDGLYQSLDSTTPGTDDLSTYGIGAGAKIGFAGFEFVGYYSDSQGLAGASGFFQFFPGASDQDPISGNFNGNDTQTYYVQGAYSFGATKIAASYGQNETDLEVNPATFADNFSVKNKLTTVGIYHDVTSWLKLVAEYNHMESDTVTGGVNATPGDADTFSVGSFFFW